MITEILRANRLLVANKVDEIEGLINSHYYNAKVEVLEDRVRVDFNWIKDASEATTLVCDACGCQYEFLGGKVVDFLF